MLVSIIMPLYNASLYMKEAIESVLQQSYATFELIIVNDGSTDKSEEVIKSFDDPRIRYEKFTENKGIVAALNHAISIANGIYIFRMDADDICLPDRIEKQLNFLIKHPEIDLLGSRAIFFSGNPNISHEVSNEILNSSKVIELMLFLCSPFIHPTIVFKRTINGNQIVQYGAGFNYGDDYELFTRNVGNVKYGYLNEPVLQYRVHQSVNRLSGSTYKKKYKLSTYAIRKKYFLEQHLYFPEKLLWHYEDLFYGDVLSSRKNALFTILFYRKMREHYSRQELNSEEAIYLDLFLRKSFFNAYYRYSKTGLFSFWTYVKFCRKNFKMPLREEIKFILKCCLKK